MTEVVAPGRHVERALELAGADRRLPAGDDALRTAARVLEGEGLPLADGLALEARLGRERISDARAGARRFVRATAQLLSVTRVSD